MTAPATHNRRTVLVAAGTALLLLLAVAVWIWLSRDSGTQPESLGTRTVSAGAVDVTMTARSLDADGARFQVAFDTHTIDLDTDLPDAAELRVNGQPSGDPGVWDGDRPGGHHREGTLTFETDVPTGATVELRITGLPQDAVGTWSAP
jgi:hypothetical protein